ncbi:MAG TPA: hypothetical protein VG839_05980 [Asticcacaulis sp.]|nr:hypothetical protein [Asticcacaulis sp.]
MTDDYDSRVADPVETTQTASGELALSEDLQLEAAGQGDTGATPVFSEPLLDRIRTCD